MKFLTIASLLVSAAALSSAMRYPQRRSPEAWAEAEAYAEAYAQPYADAYAEAYADARAEALAEAEAVPEPFLAEIGGGIAGAWAAHKLRKVVKGSGDSQSQPQSPPPSTGSDS